MPIIGTTEGILTRPAAQRISRAGFRFSERPGQPCRLAWVLAGGCLHGAPVHGAGPAAFEFDFAPGFAFDRLLVKIKPRIRRGLRNRGGGLRGCGRKKVCDNLPSHARGAEGENAVALSSSNGAAVAPCETRAAFRERSACRENSRAFPASMRPRSLCRKAARWQRLRFVESSDSFLVRSYALLNGRC